MTATDVVTLSEAKAFLRVDFSDDDALITSLIKAAVGLIERSTEHRLYRRAEIVKTSKIGYTAFQYPLHGAEATAMDSQGTYTMQYRYETLRTELFWGNGFWYEGNYDYFFNPSYYNTACVTNFDLVLDVGYDSVDLIPDDLITAVKQVIVDRYENRDITEQQLLNNISIFIAPYRRFVTLM